MIKALLALLDCIFFSFFNFYGFDAHLFLLLWCCLALAHFPSCTVEIPFSGGHWKLALSADLLSESTCTAFLHHPAGFFPALDLPLRCRIPRKKKERRHWLRLSTYGRLEITLSIGIISEWTKPDMTMSSRANRLWHVPWFLFFFFFAPHWWCDEFHKQKPPRQEEDKPNYCLFRRIGDSSTRTISSTLRA